MSTPSAGTRPIPALIVATWYPGPDDPGRGRFVADQAEALLNTGRVRPLVASFDVAYVDSSAGARRAELITAHLRGALEARSDVISPNAWASDTPIGTARLPTPEPLGRAMSAGPEADQRMEALELLADRLDVDGLQGVVHAHTGYPDGYAALGVARRLGWPLVITEHASFVARQLRQPAQRKRYLEAAQAAARFIAVSEILASELRTAIPEMEDKLVVIPNAIPLEAFEVHELADRTPDQLIFVGYRKERKGMVVLLRAFADVLEERPGATLRLIGKSPSDAEEERWHEMADNLGIASAVRFEGPADRAAVAKALSRASVFVHPSPRETFGIVTLEALASGLPVVATQSGGISSILEDEALGALVPPQDPRMLARAVLRTLDRRADFDPAALRRAVEPFSSEVVAPRLAQLYGEVIAENGPPRASRGSASPARPISWEGRAVAIEDRLVVIAYDTARAARYLESMPPDLLGRMTVVTHGDAGEEHLPDGIGRVVEARRHATEELRRRGLTGPRGRLKDRLVRVVANPIALVRRLLNRGDVSELRWQSTVSGLLRAFEAGAAAEGADHRSVPEVLCLDAVDYAVAQRLIAAGRLRATPGGLAWLADRWTALQGAGGASPEEPLRDRRPALEAPSSPIG